MRAPWCRSAGSGRASAVIERRMMQSALGSSAAGTHNLVVLHLCQVHGVRHRAAGGGALSSLSLPPSPAFLGSWHRHLGTMASKICCIGKSGGGGAVRWGGTGAWRPPRAPPGCWRSCWDRWRAPRGAGRALAKPSFDFGRTAFAGPALPRCPLSWRPGTGCRGPLPGLSAPWRRPGISAVPPQLPLPRGARPPPPAPHAAAADLRPLPRPHPLQAPAMWVSGDNARRCRRRRVLLQWPAMHGSWVVHSAAACQLLLRMGVQCRAFAQSTAADSAVAAGGAAQHRRRCRRCPRGNSLYAGAQHPLKVAPRSLPLPPAPSTGGPTMAMVSRNRLRGRRMHACAGGQGAASHARLPPAVAANLPACPLPATRAADRPQVPQH